MGFAFLAIVAKLAYIQGIGSGQYVAVGQSEWTHTVTLSGERGAIVDRSGRELAMSIPQTTLYADPRQVTDPRGEAARLAPVLGITASRLQSLLSQDAGFVYLDRTVNDATAAAVAKLNLDGVYSLQEPKRFYPAGPLASALIGSVGTDDTGLGGLESMYNSRLQGKAGKLIEKTDPQGRQLPGGLQQYQAPAAGQDVVTTLSQSLQYDAEQALAQAIVAAGAKSGIAMLMDTKTGDILADANLSMPTTGTATTPAVPVSIPAPAGTATAPGTAQAQPIEAPSASGFTQVYEPGSVNKLITISAALQEGTIKPSDIFTIPNSYPVAGTTFHDAESHATEHWNVTDILANSSNIGTIQIAQRLGKTDLLKYIHAYGEGSRTPIGFPGESQGLLPTYWSGTSIADVPIGQGIGVTAAQMLAAYNTIANGGVYVAPRLVDGFIDSSGKEQVVPAAPSRRVVSTTVADEMTTMLDEVVKVGTGTAANLDPYTVAGKTGTALVPQNGGYLAGHYVASFAGFLPAEKPSVTAMVQVFDTPNYGAAASAPTFKVIARDALQELKVPPQAKQPPAPGVPLATPATATGAGEVAGAPLPGLATPASVATTTVVPPTTTAPPTTSPPTTGVSHGPSTTSSGSGSPLPGPVPTTTTVATRPQALHRTPTGTPT